MDILDVNTLFGAYPAQHAESNAEGLSESLTRHGVKRAMTLSTWGVFYNDMAGNQETLAACGQYDGIMYPVGTVNPMTFWDGDEMLKHLSQTSFHMIRFFPHLQGWPIDFAPFARIVKTLSECGKPLMERSLTMPRPARGWRLWTDGGEPVMISAIRPGDATAIARILADYPAPVILEGVGQDNLIEALTILRSHEQFLLETHRLTVPDGLARIRDSVGAQRIVFGSGGPALSAGAALDYVRKSSLSAEEQALVLGGNAAFLLEGAR